MNKKGPPVNDDKLHLPCRWANKKMNGHWYVFPPMLATMYDELKRKKKALNEN